MVRSAAGIFGLLIFLVIVIGAGILIYRFVVSENTDRAVIVINNEGEFINDEQTLENDEVFYVQNHSNENQTVKKSSDDSTLVEVSANSPSRELTLPANTSVELYLAGDQNQKISVKVGEPPASESAPEEANTESDGSTQGTSTTSQSQPLPNTGPENNLIFVGLILLGGLLYKVSKKFFL